VDKQKQILGLQHDKDRLQEQLNLITMLYKQEQKQNRITPLRFLRTDKATRIYTGLPTKKAFQDLFQYVRTYSHKMKYWTGQTKVVSTRVKRKFVSSPKKSGPGRKLTQQQELLLVLMKLRQDLTNQMLADIFGISATSVSSIFNTWIKLLATILKPLIFWPDKVTVLKMMPPSLKKDFPQLRCTIDCTEVFIDRPRHLELQAQTWSDYKKNNTLKFLVGIAPNGHISFLSKAWGGRASD
jgi:hypothetical protein